MRNNLGYLHLVLILLLVVNAFSALGQQRKLDVADSLRQIDNYTAAISFYEEVDQRRFARWEKASIDYHIGECFSRLAIPGKAAEFFIRSFRRDRQDKELLYEIATELKKDGQYNKALKYFKKYRRKGYGYLKEAVSEIEGIDKIIAWSEQKSMNTIQLNRDLSTPYFDFAPCLIDQVGSKMILTSTRLSRDKNEQASRSANLFYAVKRDGKWKDISRIDSALSNVGVVSMDYERNVMFFTKCDQRINYGCGIYYGFMDGDMMGEVFPVKIEKPDSVRTTIGHPSFSNSLGLMVFVSNMSGGYGGNDLWAATYDKASDSWGQPFNLGPEINTSRNELYPQLSSDGTLYFSSEGHVSMGGLDIFKAKRIGGYLWGDIENLKPPLNSSNDDFGIVFNQDGVSGYFSSNRKGGLGRDDIYNFNLATEDSTFSNIGQVESSDSSSGPEFEALVQLFNQTECEVNVERLTLTDVKVYPNPNDGKFSLSFVSNRSASLLIRIFSSLGQQIYNGSIEVHEGSELEQFNIEAFENGVYYIQILEGCKTMYSEKVLVN